MRSPPAPPRGSFYILDVQSPLQPPKVRIHAAGSKAVKSLVISALTLLRYIDYLRLSQKLSRLRPDGVTGMDKLEFGRSETWASVGVLSRRDWVSCCNRKSAAMVRARYLLEALEALTKDLSARTDKKEMPELMRSVQVQKPQAELLTKSLKDKAMGNIGTRTRSLATRFGLCATLCTGHIRR